MAPTHSRSTQPMTSVSASGLYRTWHQSPKTAWISTNCPRCTITPMRAASRDGAWRTQTCPVISPTTGEGVDVEVGVGITVGVTVGAGVCVGDGVDVGEGVGLGANCATTGAAVGVAVARTFRRTHVLLKHTVKSRKARQ